MKLLTKANTAFATFMTAAEIWQVAERSICQRAVVKRLIERQRETHRQCLRWFTIQKTTFPKYAMSAREKVAGCRRSVDHHLAACVKRLAQLNCAITLTHPSVTLDVSIQAAGSKRELALSRTGFYRLGIGYWITTHRAEKHGFRFGNFFFLISHKCRDGFTHLSNATIAHGTHERAFMHTMQSQLRVCESETYQVFVDWLSWQCEALVDVVFTSRTSSVLTS